MIMNKLATLPLILALAATSTACTRNTDAQVQSASSAQAQTATSEYDTSMRVRLVSGGLGVGQPGLHVGQIIEFGTARDEVVAAVSELTGIRGRVVANAECPSGPAEHANFGALQLTFEQGRFTGWVLDGPTSPAIESEWGLAIGVARSEIGDEDQDPVVFTEGSLGTEFDDGGMGGLLTGPGPDARVKTLFAGTTCFAR
jgi:hypothetical protein